MSAVLRAAREGSRLLRDLLSAERFSGTDGLLQGLDPRVKLVSVVALIAAAAACRGVAAPALLVVASALLAFASGIPLRYFVPRAIVFIPLFAGVIALPLPFITPGSPLASLDIGPIAVTVTREGALTAAAFTLRVWACVSLAILLTLTTGHSALLRAMEGLGAPRTIVMTWGIAFRYSLLFLDMVYRRLRAIESRTVRGMAAGDVRGALTSSVGCLLVGAYERGERVYMAMRSRGYSGEFRSPSAMRCGPMDCAFGALSAALVVVVLLIEWAA